jgi:hypothetical protein
MSPCASLTRATRKPMRMNPTQMMFRTIARL